MRQMLDEDQRLVILRGLLDFGGNANESVIQSCLDAYGHRISRDTVRTHMKWLEEQGLVRIDDVAGCYVGTLTARGQDASEGRAAVPGVKKPRAR
ncbi:winged helix-turn-helix domain-containing protein [Neptunomonas antarctica]|uniref:Ribonuclease R winged-helix domain-containing protein n=1 Tax=Neptunomonas antarctica TaxID=619304 RepID=A0A1N7MPZ0_9GAMM|nr:winged helix-turn-helix domain-containing protein [Neptunomonas antarctica]SIS88068.1 Ribonuclease R winged-helix domain-containing protein [Neptunomonas antarctica]